MNKEEVIKAIGELFFEKMQLGECPTNGEVIQALFPKIELGEKVYNRKRYFLSNQSIEEFDFNTTDRWWNTPYKTESEES